MVLWCQQSNFCLNKGMNKLYAYNEWNTYIYKHIHTYYIYCIIFASKNLQILRICFPVFPPKNLRKFTKPISFYAQLIFDQGWLNPKKSLSITPQKKINKKLITRWINPKNSNFLCDWTYLQSAFDNVMYR